MAYSKHFYIFRALDYYRQNLNSISEHDSYLLNFIAYLAKKNMISCVQTVEEILNKIETRVFNKEYLLSVVHSYLHETLEPFEKVSIENIVEYLTDSDVMLFENDARYWGERSQPEGLSDLVSRLFNFNENDSLIDLGSGYSSFLNYVHKHYNSSMILHGVEISNSAYVYGSVLPEIENSSVQIFNNDIFKQTFTRKYVKVFSVPPFGGIVSENDTEMINLIQRTIGSSSRELSTGFILKALEILEDNGVAIVCVPLGFMFRMGADYLLRKYLIENKYLKSIIELPAGIFSPYTGIPTALLILSKNTKTDEVIYLNVSSISSKTRRGGKGLFKEDVDKIFEIYESTEKEIPGLKQYISYEEIKEKDYYLSSHEYFLTKKLSLSNIDNYVCLGEVLSANILRGVQYKANELDNKKTTDKTNCFYLSLKNIEDGIVDNNLSKLDFIDEKYTKSILQENDIVMGMVVSDTIKVALITHIGDAKIVPASNIYIIRPNSSIIDPLYLKILLESDKANVLYRSFASVGTLHSISVDFLNELQIPLPSLDVQKEIASKYRTIEEERAELRNRLNQLSLKKKQILESQE